MPGDRKDDEAVRAAGGVSCQRITFEVDAVKLFDAIVAMRGDSTMIGQRLVEQLLQNHTGIIDGLGMAIYGVSVVDRETVAATLGAPQ